MGVGACSPKKRIEICGPQIARNALKQSMLPSPCYFCIILNLLRSHQTDLFGSGRGGGGACTLRATPVYGPEINYVVVVVVVVVSKF